MESMKWLRLDDRKSIVPAGDQDRAMSEEITDLFCENVEVKYENVEDADVRTNPNVILKIKYEFDENDKSSGNDGNLTVKKEEKVFIAVDEQIIDELPVSYNPIEIMCDDSYPDISRVNVTIEQISPLVDRRAESRQSFLDIQTAAHTDPPLRKMNQRRSRKRKQRRHPERKHPENSVDAIRKARSFKRRKMLCCSVPREGQFETSPNIDHYNSRCRTEMQTPCRIDEAKMSNRTETSNTLPSDSEGNPVFVIFNADTFVEIEDDPNKIVCECAMKNVSEVEIQLKSELKRLIEQNAGAGDLEKRWLEQKISKLKYHLAQPHICDRWAIGTKCRWCVNDLKKMNPLCETKKFERQLDRLKLLFSIHRSKGEEEKWLQFKIRETEFYLSELKFCCGIAALAVPRQHQAHISPQKSPCQYDEFFCTSCSSCAREHRSILGQLKKLSAALKKT